MWHSRMPDIGSRPRAIPIMLPTNGTKAVELYDQRNDPQEWINLAGRAKYADNVRELPRFPPNLNAPTAEKTDPQERAQRTAVQWHYGRSCP